MGSTAISSQTRLVEYDALHRRLWIHGQRLHHGATGTVVALTASLGLLAGHGPSIRTQSTPRSLTVLAIAGWALMAHDWKDRSVWFARGPGPIR
jgi:hypothetical protein